MTAISSTNIYSASWNNLKAVILAGVTDPRTGKKPSTRKWIYSTFPYPKSLDFKEYPLIVILPAEVTDEAVTLLRTFKDNIFRFEVTVYVPRNLSLGSTAGADILDSICDELKDDLENSTGTGTLDDGKMWNLRIDTSGFVDEEINQQRMLSRSFIVEMNSQVNT